MSIHHEIRTLLYDYAAGSLNPGETVKVEQHLERCASCQKEYDGMRKALSVLPVHNDPAATLPSAFWKELLNDVSAQLPARAKRPAMPGWATDWFAFVSVPRHQAIIGTATLLVLAVVIAGSWLATRHEQMPVQVAVTAPPAKTPAVPAVNKRMKQYLRRSKALLVGINNLPVAEGAQVDLSLERNTSRELLQEARFLRGQPLDGRSAALINDLEKIQIALANSREREELPGLRLIRGGIRDENLLFKIRIAETVIERINDETVPPGR
jgi:hypothetical protein